MTIDRDTSRPGSLDHMIATLYKALCVMAGPERMLVRLRDAFNHLTTHRTVTSLVTPDLHLEFNRVYSELGSILNVCGRTDGLNEDAQKIAERMVGLYAAAINHKFQDQESPEMRMARKILESLSLYSGLDQILGAIDLETRAELVADIARIIKDEGEIEG